MKFILVFPILIICFGSFCQESVIGKWESCTSFEKNPRVSCISFVTYTFQNNGTYEDNRNYISNDITYDYHGTWNYSKNKLTIDVADENGMIIPPYKTRIYWVNQNLFYSKGREGFLGPRIFTFYKKLTD